MEVDRRARSAAVELLSEWLPHRSKAENEYSGVAGYIDIAMTLLREPVQQIASEFTFETGTPGEAMRRKAIHAALDVLLDEDDRFLSLAMTTPKGHA